MVAAQLLVGIAWLAAYIALEWVSFIHEYKGLPVTPWNPGLGALFALMILGGVGYALVLFAGVLIAEFVVLKSSLDLADRLRHRRHHLGRVRRRRDCRAQAAAA